MADSYVKPGQPCSKRDYRTINKRLSFVLGCIGEDKGNLIILDIGTGYGVYRSHLLSKSACYIGIDVDESGLKRAQEDDRGADLVLMSAEHLAFKDDLFDIVLLIEVLEHVKDDRKALEEIHRVLKPGGLAILTAPNKLFPFETHGISIGPRIIGTRGLGFPLLPYLPTPLRERIANARVYTAGNLTKLLTAVDLRLDCVDFIGPSLDKLRINFSGLRIDTPVDLLSRLIYRWESMPVARSILTTIIVCCEKVKET